MSKIIKVILDNGDELKFIRKNKEDFPDNKLRDYHFNRQRDAFEINLLRYFNLNLEEWARDEYNLIDESSIGRYTDEEILKEAEFRNLMPEDCSQNTNIYNQDFIDRFSVIISRGDDVEIEKMLDLLEYRFKIG